MTKPSILKEFEIRWSDLDANRHLANSSYLNLMSQTRMDYLSSHGFGHKEMMARHLGPVIFYEHLYYFKEIFPGKPIFVSLEIKGLSKDGTFFEFEHGLYDAQGNQYAACELMGGWIDLQTRKLTALPEELTTQVFSDLSKTHDFRWLTKEDTRKHQRFPKPIDPISK